MSTAPSFDARWDAEIYARGRQLNRWPYDAVVSFLFRHAPRERARSQVRVLEIGCGAGNNLWFAAREGFQVSGVDASELAIAAAARRFGDEGVVGDLRVADFRALPFGDGGFDLAIDRLALSCAPRAAAFAAERELARVLAPGARLFTNVYSTAHSSYAWRADSSRAADRTHEDAQDVAHGELASRGDGAANGAANDERDEHRARVASGSVERPSVGTLAGLPHVCFWSAAALDELWSRGWRTLSREHLELTDTWNPAVGVHAEWRLVLERIA